MRDIRLDEPRDVRYLIKDWILEVCNNPETAFREWRNCCPVLNTWLRTYEVEQDVEKVADLEKRIDAIEHEKSIDKVRIEVLD